jgi:putative endopeptidase
MQIKFQIFALLICVAAFPGWSTTKLSVSDILDASALKPSVDPCQDFNQFACGGWLDRTQIPADKNSVNHQSTALLDRTDEQLHQLLVRLEKGDRKLQTPAAKQLVDYYTTCMSRDSTSHQALSLLKSEIKKIETLKDKKQLTSLIAQLHLSGTNAFFAFGAGQDLKDSSSVIGFLDQGALGLPEPTYYFDNDAKSIETRVKYRSHIENLLVLSGQTRGAALQAAQVIFDFEKELASKAYPFNDRQNPTKINHPMTREMLAKSAPSIDWDGYFKSIGAPNSALNMNEPEYFTHLNEVLTQASLTDLKSYLTWRVIHRSAHHLSLAFDQEHFDFWSRYLRGQKTMLPRWKQCTQDIERSLGYALAEVYVKTVDTASILTKINAMIDWIKATFKEDLNQLDWLDATTKAEAIQKLAVLKQKVGAPTKWRDYSTLKTDRTSLLANDMHAFGFEAHRDVLKIGKPVDTLEWDMMPWEVNAYYDPPKNEFNFPFGILQPPSFDVHASDGANLGSFGGGTIGHELTHGYDNNGRQFDAKGNLKDWWSEETKKRFEDKSQCFIKQANAYQIKDVGLSVDGKKTLGENLADQGGVKLGYAALISAQSKRAPAANWLGKYNERQQYWIAYAHSWCTKQRPEALRVQIKTNEHPPTEFRINAVVMNRPEFAKDFACKEGAPMAPKNRCEIW